MNAFSTHFKPWWRRWELLGVCLSIVLLFWLRGGFDSVYIDTDIARDLKEISNIQAGRVVWLGPWLGPGLHASSSYYYFFFPAVAISGGKIVSMIALNVFVAACSLVFFGFLATRKYGYRGVLVTLLLGMLPMILGNVLHPGNGYTYVYFLLMAFTALWFEVPVFLASLCAGMAVAFHPAAAMVMPFLLWEWWQRGHHWKSVLLSAAAFGVPLAPLVAFEVITKGFIIRSFLARPDSGFFHLGFTWQNLTIFAELLGVPLVVFLVGLAMAAYMIFTTDKRREKVWSALALVFLIISLFFTELVGRYVFGIALVMFFVVSFSFLKERRATLLLLFTAVALLLQTVIAPLPVVARNASFVESVGQFIATESSLDKSKKVAIVAALNQKTEVPQADDYRFVLRNRGFDVVETNLHHEAEVLVMVIEAPDFKWETWQTWEIESFGSRKVKSVKHFNGVAVIIFEKN